MWISTYIRYVYNTFLFMHVIHFLFIPSRITHSLTCHKFIGGEMMLLLLKLGFNPKWTMLFTILLQPKSRVCCLKISQDLLSRQKKLNLRTLTYIHITQNVFIKERF